MDTHPHPEPQGAKELVAALVKAQGEFVPIEKNASVSYPVSRGPAVEFRYADLSAVIDATRPALVKNGLAVSQCFVASTHDGGMFLETKLMHTGGGEIRSLFPLPKTVRMQETGSAITYARRYALCAILGVVADPDDDGQAAASGQAKATPAAPAAKPGPKRLFNPPAANGAWVEVDGVLEERGSWEGEETRMRALYKALDAMEPERLAAHADLIAKLPPAGRAPLYEKAGLDQGDGLDAFRALKSAK